MKKWTKNFMGISAIAVLTFVVLSLSCGKMQVKGSAETTFAGTADTAYAETPRGNQSNSDSLKVLEALQTSFRSISQTVLPSVVVVNVTETKTVKDPFYGMQNPFEFFFGRPDSNKDKDGGTREYEHKGLGSGVIVRKTGNKYYVLTNNHVAGSATKISIKLFDDREFEGTLVGADERIDIALVSFESKDDSIVVADLGDSDLVQTGDICLAIGAPLGYSQSVTQGIVSATSRSEPGMSNISDFIQTDAAINQGNSGGPLVNIYGEIIGINTWIASQSGGSQGLGFAIPINNVKKAIDAFIKDGKVTYGWLGVSMYEISDSMKKDLGLEGKNGAFVAELYIKSPADKGGIKPGDYIVEVNGKSVKDVNQLMRDVGGLQAGTTAKIGVIRGGKRIPDITVKIEARAKDIDSQSGKFWPGFLVTVLDDDMKKQLNIEDKKLKGVVVTNVEERSPAAALRIQNGDVITGVNGVAVSNLAEFYLELSKVDKSINFDIYSNGGTITTGTYKF